MDAMGFSLKKQHSVSSSLSGSFNHDPAENPKFPGIVSTVPLLLLLSEARLARCASLSSSTMPAPSSLACRTNFSREGLHARSGWSFYAWVLNFLALSHKME